MWDLGPHAWSPWDPHGPWPFRGSKEQDACGHGVGCITKKNRAPSAPPQSLTHFRCITLCCTARSRLRLRGRTVRCARAVRKVGHSPPPVGSFLGVGLPQGTIAVVCPCSINPPSSCMYVPLQTGTLRPVYGDTFSGCLLRGIIICQVCGKRDTLECSTCDLYLCRGCMDEHTCDIDVPE